MSSLPGSASDLNGNAPDTHNTALLLIDVINHFEFPRGEELFRAAMPIAPCIRELKRRARAAGIPAIYVNDNFGRWQSSFQQLLNHCLEPDVRGKPFVEQLKPEEHDYFVLKPKHSAFYQTPLDILLKHLGSTKLVLTGLSTNSCVLFTGHDAYMRDLQLFVPRDCVAACTPDEHERGLEQMKNTLKAHVCPSSEIDFAFLSQSEFASRDC